jgi:beta-lactamase class A
MTRRRLATFTLIYGALACACATNRPAAYGGALVDRLQTAIRGAGGRVGVGAMWLDSGATVLLRGDEHFPMQSVYKLPIAMAALAAVDRGVLALEQDIRVTRDDLIPEAGHSPLRDAHPAGDVDVSVKDLLRLAVSESDGSASDVLLRLVGGAARVSAYVGSLGVEDMAIVDRERDISTVWEVQYRNFASPRAALALLRVLAQGRGLSSSSRTLLLELMTSTGTGQRRIKGGVPRGTRVAHKTGTSGTANGITAATNDIGLVTLPDGGTLAVAVFVSDSPAPDDLRDGVIAEIARELWQAHGR